MKHNDKPEFAKKMAEMLYAFARKPETGMVDSYFKQLASLPLDYVLRGIDQAIRNKREGDLYDQRAVPTVPEIARLARVIMDSERPMWLTDFCDACNHTGYILEEREGRSVARKCECLLRRIEEQKEGGVGEGKIYS